MQTKITAALATITTLIGLQNSASAQFPVAKPLPANVTLSGDSLVGINQRSSENDFGKFFDLQNSGSSDSTNEATNATSEQLPLSESISLPSTPIFLQPAQSGDGNDGLQLQLDLGKE
jgi:hypothetical protein